MSECQGCTKHVQGYNVLTGKHYIRASNSDGVYPATLVSNTLTHGLVHIVERGGAFVGPIPRPGTIAGRRKGFEPQADVSLAFIMRLSYTLDNSTTVPCNSPYYTAIQDIGFQPSFTNFGGECHKYCATTEVVVPPPVDRQYAWFAGDDVAPCANYPDPGIIINRAPIDNSLLADGQYGNAVLKSEVLKDFPISVPARYTYDVEVIGRATHFYYGVCYLNFFNPFGTITRKVDSGGLIYDGEPSPFCVPTCSGDVGVFNATYYAKRYEVQSRFPGLLRASANSLAEWTICDYNPATEATDPSANFKFMLPFGRYDSFCQFDPPPRTVTFGAFGDVLWPEGLTDGLHFFHWRRSGNETFDSGVLKTSSTILVKYTPGSATLIADGTDGTFVFVADGNAISLKPPSWANTNELTVLSKISNEELVLSELIAISPTNKFVTTTYRAGSAELTMANTLDIAADDTVDIDGATYTVDSVQSNTTVLLTGAVTFAQATVPLTVNVVEGSNTVTVVGGSPASLIAGDIFSASGLFGPGVVSIRSKGTFVLIADRPAIATATDQAITVVKTAARTELLEYQLVGQRSAYVTFDIAEPDGKQEFTLTRLPYPEERDWWDANFAPDATVNQYVLVYSPTRDLSNWVAVRLAELKDIEHAFDSTVDKANINLVHTDDDVLYAGIKHGYYQPAELDTGTQLLSSFASYDYTSNTESSLLNVPRTAGNLPAIPAGNYGYDTYVLPGDTPPGDVTACQLDKRHTHTVTAQDTTYKAVHTGGLEGTDLGAAILAADGNISFELIGGNCEDGDDSSGSQLDATNLLDALDTVMLAYGNKTTANLVELEVLRIKPVLA